MTTTRAAKYLAPIDLGKTIQFGDRHTGNWPTGTLQEIDATQDALIRLTIIAGKDSGTYDVHPEDEITITGKPSPTRQGEQPAGAFIDELNTAHVRIEPNLSLGEPRHEIRATQRGIVNGRQLLADVARNLGNPEPEVQRILDRYDKARTTLTNKPNEIREIRSAKTIGQSGNTGHKGKCGHNGGQGIGAGHTCTCVRTAHHSLNSEQPHGCSCGATWKD